MDNAETDPSLAILPCDVGVHVLVRLDDETETEMRFVCQLFGFSDIDLALLKASRYYKHLKFYLLKNNNNLIDLFTGGHRKRVKKYNKLVKRLILRSPERFVSLTAPYATHKFLPEMDSEDDTKEPAYYYPIDGPSVDFWNRVHETERMLKRFKVASLWKKREDRIEHDDKPEMVVLHQVDESLSAVAFRMEHQFARVLLMQNLHFKNKEI